MSKVLDQPLSFELVLAAKKAVIAPDDRRIARIEV